MKNINDNVQFVNLTRHAIVVVGADGQMVTRIPPSGVTVRLIEEPAGQTIVGGVPVTRVRVKTPEALPPPKENVIVIVPAVVALVGSLFLGRTDLAAPGGIVRDLKTGRPTGARYLKIVETVSLNNEKKEQ